MFKDEEGQIHHSDFIEQIRSSLKWSHIHRLRNKFKEQNCKSENVLEELQEGYPALKPKDVSKIMDELTISEGKIDVDQFLGIMARQ